MENDDTDTGGDELSVSEAASAYAKAMADGADDGQPDDIEQAGETADDDLHEGDEPEGDETDGDPEADSQADDEDDAEPESEKGRYVAHNGRVRLPDGSESTVADLIAGNMMDRDYRQKTMAHSEEVKSFKAQSDALEASKEQLSHDRELVAQLITAIVGQPPDPATLASDPVKYMQDKANYDAWLQHLNSLQQQDLQSRQQKAQETQEAEVKKADEEWRALTDKLTYLKDSKKAATFANNLKSYLGTYGFGPPDMKAVALNHRLALIADKARQWDRLQASKATVAKKVEGRPPVQKGGRRLNPSEHRARAAGDAFAKAKQSGSLEDVTAAFIASLNKG